MHVRIWTLRPWTLRADGGRGLKSVEAEYKQIKVKAAVKLYSNKDPTMGLVREFEQHAADKGHQSGEGGFFRSSVPRT